LQVELVLPTSRESDLDYRQQYEALKILLRAVFKEAMPAVDLSTEEALDDSDGVYVLSDSAGESVTVVTFPTADVLAKLVRLQREMGPKGVLILANPQWMLLGSSTPDLGFAATNKRDKNMYEAFIAGFDLAYSLRRLRIKGEQVRLVKALPSRSWHVFAIRREEEGSIEFLASEDRQPNYWEVERLLSRRKGSIASQDWFTRARLEIEEAFETQEEREEIKLEPRREESKLEPRSVATPWTDTMALTSATLPECPRTVGAQVSQAATGLRNAVEAGITRLQMELVLPTSSEADLDERQQNVLLKVLLRAVLKEAVGVADLSTVEVLDDSDGVYVLRDTTGKSDITVVTFATPSVLENINALDQGAGAKGVLLLVNPQWLSMGRLMPDFGFLPAVRRKLLETFIKTFELAYSFRRLRIKGQKVRLLKALVHDPWRVFVIPRNGSAAELVASEDWQPAYREVEKLLTDRPQDSTIATQVDKAARDWLSRAELGLKGAFSAPPVPLSPRQEGSSMQEEQLEVAQEQAAVGLSRGPSRGLQGSGSQPSAGTIQLPPDERFPTERFPAESSADLVARTRQKIIQRLREKSGDI
jgi:hypothetical protein